MPSAIRTFTPTIPAPTGGVVCRDGLPWIGEAYRQAVLEAAHSLDGLVAVLVYYGSEVSLRERTATCPLPSHGRDEHASLSFGGAASDGRLWHCLSEGLGGDAIKLAALCEGWDPQADWRKAIIRVGDILRIPRPGQRGGRDPVAAWHRIQRSAIAKRHAQPQVVAMPMAAQIAAFGALLDAADEIAPRSAAAAEDYLLRVRGIPASAQERCGQHRLLVTDELAALSVMLAHGPDAAICEAAGILRRADDGALRLSWRDDSLLMFHMSADTTTPLYAGARRLDAATKAGRYRMPHGDGAALPESIAPSTERVEVRDHYGDGAATRTMVRALHYRSRPVLYGLPQAGEAIASRDLVVCEGAIKAMAAVAMGRNAIATCGVLGWESSTPHADRAASSLGGMIGDIAHLVVARISVVPDHDERVEVRARMLALAESLADALRLGHGLDAAAVPLADVVGLAAVGHQADGGWSKDFDDALRILGPAPAPEF